MKNNLLRHYSVQPIENGQPSPKSACRQVEALGPIQAAEMTMAETLVFNGLVENARAVVWSMGEDFQPVTVTLYRQASS